MKLFFGFVVIAVVACQAPAQNHVDAAADPLATCTKLGASCTFSPGKLGSCVEVQTGGPVTFVCQSQH